MNYLSTFELTIQNTTIPQVRNLFSVIAVFISFPLARCCAPPPHPAPPFLRGGSTKKISPVASALALGHVCVGVCVVGVVGVCVVAAFDLLEGVVY